MLKMKHFLIVLTFITTLSASASTKFALNESEVPNTEIAQALIEKNCSISFYNKYGEELNSVAIQEGHVNRNGNIVAMSEVSIMESKSRVTYSFSFRNEGLAIEVLASKNDFGKIGPVLFQTSLKEGFKVTTQMWGEGRFKSSRNAKSMLVCD
jgi:hypothetical protein